MDRLGGAERAAFPSADSAARDSRCDRKFREQEILQAIQMTRDVINV
jgi:hypothetical protein